MVIIIRDHYHAITVTIIIRKQLYKTAIDPFNQADCNGRSQLSLHRKRNITGITVNIS